LTIQNATGNGKAGIYVSAGGCNILNSIIQNNGPGIIGDDCGDYGLVLENVKIRNNTGTEGDGIGIISGNLTIRGTGNEITNNGRHGIFTQAGDVTIEGTGTEIHDNGGWGIRVEPEGVEGNVVIHDGAMSKIYKNGQGGIMGACVSLPPNFVVEDNGGPGIVVMECEEGLVLESIKVRNNTGAEGDGISVISGSVTIEGTCEIHDNGGWGICAEGGKVDIHDGAMSSTNKNGKGGIMGEYGVKLPPNFVVEDNGGPGIVAMECKEGLVLESIKVRNNEGDGIGVWNCNVVIKGTGNEITNNGGRGIFLSSGGNLTIEGTGTEIHGNGGWGIFAKSGSEGKVEIYEGAMTEIKNNGKGGLYGWNVRLPRGFVIEDNGGPGLVSIGNGDLILESIKVRNNKDVGIDATHDRVVIRGSGNEIINNTGDGINGNLYTSVIIEGPTEIHDNGGWGIRADEGLVEICDGVNISGNGQGDIYCPGS
jgi:hypothetical protein